MHTGLRRKMVITMSAALLVLSAAVGIGFYFAATAFSAGEIAVSRLLVASSVARTLAQTSTPWFQTVSSAQTDGCQKLSHYLTALARGDKSLVRLTMVYLDAVDGTVRSSVGTDVTAPGEVYPAEASVIDTIKARITDRRPYADTAPIAAVHGSVQLAVAPITAVGSAGQVPGAVVLEYRTDAYSSMLVRTI